jgi:glycosyltransferase involved in cell wall biosynthesis
MVRASGDVSKRPVVREPVELSVVVPVYGCAGTLRELHRRLTDVLSGLVDSYELVLVDDRSNDGAWPIMQELAETDDNVVACRLARNFGQQIAISAGLEQCCGKQAVVMDCDLQDPPESIPALYARAREGFDIVYAKRKSSHQSVDRRALNKLYFNLLQLVSGRPFDGELGSFSIISRRVIDTFLRFKERDRHYLMVLGWVGFDTSTIEYQRDVRREGRSSYSLRQLLSHAVSGLLFTTTRLLYWVIYAGIGMALIGLLLAVFFMVRWYSDGALPGWTSLIVVQFLVGGVIILCLGVASLYIAKIFEAAQQRPLYILQDRIDRRVIGDQGHLASPSSAAGDAPHGQGTRPMPNIVTPRPVR